VDDRDAGLDVTVAEAPTCEAEPIHIPGAIQPHGVLVAVEPGSLKIVQISANCADYFEAAPEALLGRPLSALVGAAASALSASADVASSATAEPVVIDVQGRPFDVLTHRHQGLLIVELERHDPDAASTDPELRAALRRLQRPTSIGELYTVAVEVVRKLTGFDRVMMYRFDDMGHGDVIEESTGVGVTSYRGLRFPASDIPRQARELYLLSWLRLIPDAAYTPVRLVPDRRPDNGEALDLSFATLRSVSLVHLEYLRNMSVQASMSVSLVDGDNLWGLIACHHHAPRHLSFATRAACEIVGRIVALQSSAHQELSVRAARRALRGTESTLVDAMRAGHTDVANALAQRGDALLQLAGAAGAAVCTGNEIRTIGATPNQAQLTSLVMWLGRNLGGGILHTHSLGELHPAAAEYASVASGLLAMTLPQGSPSCVLWFRPEVVRTVTWAGDPAKPVAAIGDNRGLHPRQSFEAWKQVVRGSSRPWRVAEIESVEDLRRRAIEADLTNQIARAEKAINLRDDMVAVVSHDLKNPLFAIQLAVKQLQLQPHVAGDERALVSVGRIGSAVAKMNALIHDLLDVAKIESGRFDVTPVPCPVSQLVSDASAVMAPLAEAKDVRLAWGFDEERWVEADPERVFQVLANLVGNAIKFTPRGGAVNVDIETTDGAVRFAVRDTGPGIADTEMAHIFDRYWQARRARHAGSGLGLYIAKGIVEAHGQRLWAESTHGAGATFFFALPAHVPAASPPATETDWAGLRA
jgi:chemotaxis family two-component system sensor kinase Cph1